MDHQTQPDPKNWPSPWREIGVLPEASLKEIFPDRRAIDDRLDTINEKSKLLVDQYQGKLAQISAKEYAHFLSQREDIEALSHSVSQLTYFLRLRDVSAVGLCNELSASLKDARAPLQKIIDEEDKLSMAKLQFLADDPDIGVYRINILKAVEYFKITPQTHNVPIFELDDAYNGGEVLFHQLHAKINAKTNDAPQDQIRVVKETAILEHAETFAYLLASSYRSMDIFRQWRGFKSPVEASCRRNQVTVDEISALRDAVHEAIPSTAHVYWGWRAKQSVTGDVKYSDSTLADQEKKIYSWKYTETLICDAYGRLSPALGAEARSFIEERRIDACPGPNRHDSNCIFRGGPYFKPMIFLNYGGMQSDVYTFGHEMGHGIHSSFSRSQNFFSTGASTLIAETVALFGERLAYEEMRRDLGNSDDKKVLDAQWTDRRIGSVFESMRRHDFEHEIYDLSVKGLASSGKFSELWKESLDKYTSGKIVLSDLSKLDWINAHHMFDNKFYNYSYSFASLVSEHLWNDYQKRGPAFVSDYTDLLRAGGSKNTQDLLAPFGIKEMNIDFWRECIVSLKADVVSLHDDYEAPVRPGTGVNPNEKLVTLTPTSKTIKLPSL